MPSRSQKNGLERIGEMIPGLDIVPLRQTLSAARSDKLGAIGATILAHPAEPEDATYQHSILCQVGMPRKKVEGNRFERRSGSASLVLHAGEMWDGRIWKMQPLPYGPKPRVVLMNLTSYAIRKGTRFVDVGNSTREFMERVGLDPQGSEYRSLRTQLAALAVCRMQLGGYANGRVINIPDTRPIHRFDVWIARDHDQQALWPSEVELSREYFDGIQEHSVPLDERAIAGLRGSALALDIYTWLAHRLCRVKRPNGDLIPWESLKEQFGQEYTRLDKFRAKFRIALAQVHEVYRTARLLDGKKSAGLRLYNSPPPVARR